MMNVILLTHIPEFLQFMVDNIPHHMANSCRWYVLVDTRKDDSLSLAVRDIFMKSAVSDFSIFDFDRVWKIFCSSYNLSDDHWFKGHKMFFKLSFIAVMKSMGLGRALYSDDDVVFFESLMPKYESGLQFRSSDAMPFFEGPDFYWNSLVECAGMGNFTREMYSSNSGNMGNIIINTLGDEIDNIIYRVMTHPGIKRAWDERKKRYWCIWLLDTYILNMYLTKTECTIVPARDWKVIQRDFSFQKSMIYPKLIHYATNTNSSLEWIDWLKNSDIQMKGNSLWLRSKFNSPHEFENRVYRTVLSSRYGKMRPGDLVE